MANKTFCDRCHKEFVKDIGYNLRKHIYLKEFDMLNMHDFDICEDCEASLHEWLENKDQKCSCNKNVVELLDLIESHEKEICRQSGKIEQLEKENEMLKNGTIKERFHLGYVKPDDGHL